MCMFVKLYLTFNFKSKVSHDVFKNKNECQLTSIFSSTISLQCYMLVVCVITIFKVSIDVWFLFLTSHTTSQNLNCGCQLMCILFLCKFCVSNVKNFAKNTHCPEEHQQDSESNFWRREWNSNCLLQPVLLNQNYQQHLIPQCNVQEAPVNQCHYHHPIYDIDPAKKKNNQSQAEP